MGSDGIHMVVAIAFNKYKQHTVEYIKPTLQSMKWYSVEMEQRKVSETAATFTVKVNNEKAWVLDTEPLEFSQVKLYMSDPWYRSLEGLALVKNLVIDGEPINVLQLTGGEGYVGSSAPHEVVASSQESTVTCGNGQIIDLRDEFDDEYHWFSPGYNNNEEYPENTECKVTFRIPPRQNFEIRDIENFDVYGDYANGCENGDYVQFTVNGKKSKKFCGEGSDLSAAWCWEDWCWPYTFEVLGNPNEDLLVEAVFKTGTKHRGWNYGFEIVVSPGFPWESEKPEQNMDDIPMLPMLAGERYVGSIATEPNIGQHDVVIASEPVRSVCDDMCMSYVPYGPQLNVPVSKITQGGWTQCHSRRYDQSLSKWQFNQIRDHDCPSDYIMVGCRRTNSDTMSLLAWTLRGNFFESTGNTCSKHEQSGPEYEGTQWYMYTKEESSGHSCGAFGFAEAPHGTENYLPILDCVDQHPEHQTSPHDQRKSLSWVLDGTFGGSAGGFRCGEDLQLLGSPDWELVIFQSR